MQTVDKRFDTESWRSIIKIQLKAKKKPCYAGFFLRVIGLAGVSSPQEETPAKPIT